MVTTPLAMRSSVCAQLAGELGMPGAGTGAGSGVAAADAWLTDNTKTDRNNGLRDMPLLDKCVQCPWSDKMRSHTVPSKTKLSITAADPMSLAMPARWWRSVPDRSTTASTALFRISTTRMSNMGLTNKARSTPALTRHISEG